MPSLLSFARQPVLSIHPWTLERKVLLCSANNLAAAACCRPPATASQSFTGYPSSPDQAARFGRGAGVLQHSIAFEIHVSHRSTRARRTAASPSFSHPWTTPASGRASPALLCAGTSNGEQGGGQDKGGIQRISKRMPLQHVICLRKDICQRNCAALAVDVEGSLKRSRRNSEKTVTTIVPYLRSL